MVEIKLANRLNAIGSINSQKILWWSICFSEVRDQR